MWKYILFILLLLPSLSFAQKETYNWHFGYGAGITFMPAGTSAKFLSDGEYEKNFWLNEGVATLSDRNGNLLFYSNGTTVWNKNHNPIRNGVGLFGGKGSARSAIIIPRPGSNRFYYVFTIEAHEIVIPGTNPIEYNNGLRYSVIDGRGDNSNGEIPTNQKNIQLLENAVEKMITINHDNGTDVWLVVYNWRDNNFYIYLITKDNIQLVRTTPRPFANTGETQFYKTCFNLDYDIGSRRLIDCDVNNGFVIYNFNPTNGTIATNNAIVLPAPPPDWDPTAPGNLYLPYGGAFSKDGSKFYGTCYNNTLLQYDFSLGSSAAIAASRTVIANASTPNINNVNFGALRLGPDGKIYVARDFSEWLGVIEQPDSAASACNFNSEGVFLEGTQSGLGLPIMMDYTNAPCVFAGAAGENITTCVGSRIELGDTSFDNGNMAFEWNPKDGLDNPYTINPKFTATKTMQYVLTVTDNVNACSDNDTIVIIVNNPPQIVKVGNATVCKAQAITLGSTANSDAYLYEWTPADFLSDVHSKTPVCTPDTTTEYILSVLDTTTGCYSYDTIKVNVTSLDDFEVAGSFFICEGKSTTLTIVDNFDSYTWSTGETTKSITVAEPCTLEVSVTSLAGCTGKRTIVIQTLESDNFNIVAPASVCAGAQTELSVNMEFASYVWSTGETTPTATITEAGMYWVTVENEYGCTASDTITVSATQINYSLTLEQITFADLCSGSATPITDNFTNNDIENIIVDTIFTLDNLSGFAVNAITFPLNVAPQASFPFTASFNGTADGIYTDTLVISISSPCSAQILVPLYANSSGTHFVINTQPHEVEPGKSLVIPINIGHTAQPAVNKEFVFTVKCDVRWDMLDVIDVRGGVIKERAKDISTWTETLLIEATYPANRASIDIELLANAFIGRDTISQIKYYDFTASAPCLLADSAVNIVKLIGCSIPLRIFNFFETTEMNVEKQPKAVVCQVTTEERGEFVLELFDLAGNLIKKHIWNKKTNNLEEYGIEFDMDLSAGSYFITLKSPNNYLTKRIVIVK